MSLTLRVSVVAFAVCIFAQLHLAAASTEFFVRLEHYENYENLLQVHAQCDSGNLCDPAFSIRVSGSWGQRDTASDCISNANQITFGDRIGSNLSNPLRFTESAVSTHPVLIQIWVMDCFINKASDRIGQFFTQLTHLPRPFLFTDRVDFGDPERAPSIELTPSGNTPLSTKMRVTVWRQCAQFYYGHDCSKFCRPLPGLSCHPETGEMLSCSGSSCSEIITTRGRAGTADTPAPAPVPAVNKPVGPGVQPDVEKQKSKAGNLTLIVALSCLLALTTVAAAAILIIIRRCGQPKKRPRSTNRALIPPTHSMAVGLRAPEYGGDDLAAPLQQQDFTNACYSLQARPLPTPGGAAAAAAAAEEPRRPDSDVYESPDEPELPPPLPARDNLLPAQCQRTPLSRSFSKPGK